jgi:hypothetical protein
MSASKLLGIQALPPGGVLCALAWSNSNEAVLLPGTRRTA